MVCSATSFDPSSVSVGIDFGTSNTVVAVATPDGSVEAIPVPHERFGGHVFMSVLCFRDEEVDRARVTRVEGGPWAIERFLEGFGPHRFIQSFKSFAASAAFQETRIFRRRYRFEDILSTFLGSLADHLDMPDLAQARRVIVGRPVRFVGSNPNDALAMGRYRAALTENGAATAGFAYEPVGAAFSFARRLEGDATVLVADFGGGTSDFSVLRFSRKAGRLSATPLGHAGVGVAGDAFDYRLIDHVVSPRLGKGGSYRSFGKALPIPAHYFVNFARWHQLAMMKGSGELKELRELARAAVDPDPLDDFIRIVEEDLGFALYRAVSQAKIALSSTEQAEFRFQGGGIDITATIARADFEAWIAADVARIEAALDEALAASGLGASAIDQVFLTGGTSFVPVIRRLFESRFGADCLYSADQFESIAYGLALIGQTEAAEDWLVS
jgi:hypothetical chaperone protein